MLLDLAVIALVYLGLPIAGGMLAEVVDWCGTKVWRRLRGRLRK